MFIKDIELYNYRNYPFAKAEFSEGVNIICGENGQGKTNLLEAVTFLACGRAFRTRKDAVTVKFDCDSAYIKGTVCDNDGFDEIEAKLFTNPRRKQIFINGVKQKTLSSLAGRFGTVLFCPDDLYIAREGASQRRAFMDNAIEQLRPRYASALHEYSKLLEHKTRILRDWPDKPSLLDTLDEFSLRMAHWGAVIISYRASYMEKLKDIAKAIHSDISAGREELELKYKTVSTVSDSLAPQEELRTRLEEHYFMRKQAEIDSRSCLSGPHKDDILININGRDIKNYGSQGQVRSAVLSMKLGERQMYENDTGSCPVLLLDDVLSELDSARQEYILSGIHSGQVLITCCTQSEQLTGLGARVFDISNGTVSLREEN